MVINIRMGISHFIILGMVFSPLKSGCPALRGEGNGPRKNGAGQTVGVSLECKHEKFSFQVRKPYRVVVEIPGALNSQ